MGPYCSFCCSKCFLPRAGAQLGRTTILATCPEGMAYDLRATGYTHRTAINPVTGLRDELADARHLTTTGIAVAVVADLNAVGQLTADAIDAFCGFAEMYLISSRRRVFP